MGGKERWCCADGTFMMSCIAGAWSWERGGIRAKRKECQQGPWKDMLQSERLVGLEGLTEWDKMARVSLTVCVGMCVVPLYYTLIFRHAW